MIARYTRPAMGRIWSDENKYRCWLTVETAASQTLARFGLVPQAAAAEDLRVGKLSGAVGTFGHLKPEHEEAICKQLGLKPADIATQVLQRDRHAAYIAALAILCSTLDKIATEVRHMQRTEVREAE